MYSVDSLTDGFDALTDGLVALTICRFEPADREAWRGAAEALLSAAERRRAGGIIDPDSRTQHVVGRAAMRALAGAATAQPPPELRVEVSSEGKPYLVDHPDLELSVTHSPGLVVVAMAQKLAVGVDVESPRTETVEPLMKLAERRFDRAEFAWLEAVPIPELPAWLARIWTIKEAVGKALGSGLGPALSEVVVERQREHLVLTRVPGPVPASRWTVHELCAPGGAERLAVAAPSLDVDLIWTGRLESPAGLAAASLKRVPIREPAPLPPSRDPAPLG